MINLSLSQRETEIILHGLGELPLKIAGPVFTKVQAAMMPTPRGEAGDPPGSFPADAEPYPKDIEREYD